MIEPQIGPCSGPLLFASSMETAVGTVTNNGSFGLINTGRKKLLVTCHHVWKEFEKEQRDCRELKMCVCLDRSPPVVLSPNLLIDCDESLDLATFDMGSLLSACAGREFYPIQHNPSPRISRGDALVFVGFPGMFRSTSFEGVQFGRMSYAVAVSDVTESFIVADISKMQTLNDRSPSLIEHENPHGGISGSPCFLFRGRGPIALAGFNTSFVLGLLRITRWNCLNPDGTIKK